MLSALSREDYYGYKLSKAIGLNVSESTLYPVLRRLEEKEILTSHTDTHNSKIRKIYSITPIGITRLENLKTEWKVFVSKVDSLLKWSEQK